MKKYLLALFAVTLLIGCKCEKKKEILDFVNPLIGTDGHGHTFPGAAYPFGMVQLSPDTGLEGWDWCSGYHYSDASIIGFSHTHLSGTGRSDLMDVMIMPMVGDIKWQAGTKENPDMGYRSRFSHDEEWASPGYYKVKLQDYDVMAELTVSPHCGFHKYAFPNTGDAHIMLDLSHHFDTDSLILNTLNVVDRNTITGERQTKGWGEIGEKYWSNQKLYFVMQTSEPFQKVKVKVEDDLVDVEKAVGKDVKAVLDFGASENKTIKVKVGISAVSVENAKQNLEKEIPGWDFDQVLADTRSVWNKELSKIKIDATDSVSTVFYTALYHAYTAPYLFSDVNGNYKGPDKEIHSVHKHNQYSVFSLWDTYRAAHPLFTITQKKRVSDMINSMLKHYDAYGLLPVWELAGNETFCMIGNHAIPVITEAYLKGIRNFDVEKAYEAMKKTSLTDRAGMGVYRKYHYIPYELENESVSKTLEYAYDDWCIAQMAKALQKEDDYLFFLNASRNYTNLFDPGTGFMRGKSSAGEWKTPFSPLYSNHRDDEYTEGNAWQYSWLVQHDVEGLIALHGGAEAFITKLDSLFTLDARLEGENASPDISGFIGQYAHGNEPSHHIAYLYNYVGQPHKTQLYVNKILTGLYHNTPDGLCGNEDCGQMSAWYVFSAMGFYPVNPVEGKYQLGAPLFDKITLSTGPEKKFVITANKESDRHIYVQEVYLNEKKLDRTWITHEEIMNGGELKFVLSTHP